MGRAGVILGLAALLALLPTAAAEGHDWPQFRGLNRDGASPETGLAASWPEAGPKELWRVPVGEGYSGVAVVGERLYTMFGVVEDEVAKEYAAALSTKDGSEIWRTPLGPKFDNEFGNGPRATPTVVDGQVFVLDSTGLLAALSAADGTMQWSMDFKEQFTIQTPRFGFSTSLLVQGGLVIVQGGGGDGNNYVGIDRKSGEIRWQRGSGRAGYNSPLVAEFAGKPRIVYVADKLYGIDVDGTEIWSQEWPQGETHAMPLHIPPDRIYVSGAEGIGARLFRIREQDGKGAVELVWEQPFMRNHFNAAVVHDGHIFGFDNATLKAIAVDSGEMAWAKRGLGKGSLVVADGKLYVLSDDGTLLLVAADGAGYRELGRVRAFDGKDRCWTAPSLAHGRLYVRNHQELVAYDVR